jgi:predicted AlkP superfamily phosphohydrolase/phosphomutase
MSDHGFGPLHKNFFINKWLMQKGLLKLKRTLPVKFQITNSFVYKILTKLKLGFLNHVFPEKIRQLNIPRLKMIRKSWDELINWSKTKVYAADLLGFNINLKGREPRGVVNPGEECETLLSELEKELCEIRDPQTGEKVIGEVLRKEKVYSGQYVEEATDLLLVMKGITYLSYPGNLNSRRLFGRPVNNWSGTHRFNGIFIMKGPRIKPSASIKKLRIIDIAPTVLYLLNQPVPKDMDGRVLEETFYPNILNTCPVTYIDVEGEKEKKHEDSLAEGEEEQVYKHLKDLGYL